MTISSPFNAAAQEQSLSDQAFSALLQGALDTGKRLEQTLVEGIVSDIDDLCITIDVGLKSEGRIALTEFDANNLPSIGQALHVFLERYEDKNGNVVLSYERARRNAMWFELEKYYESKKPIEGTLIARVKGGFQVDLNGIIAFLPGSQLDLRPIKDADELIGTKQPMMVIKVDAQRNNIVVSRKDALEFGRADARAELLANLQEGQILNGIVKNIAPYGVFIDLGGLDGLLHITDIAWKRVDHPEKVLSVGQEIKVKVIKFNRENGRVSLGMKQLEKDPWDGISALYTVGEKYTGKVTTVREYGAFVELHQGVEGLVYVNDMTWSKQQVNPADVVCEGDVVDVMVLEIDTEKHRLSLGMKQCLENPFTSFSSAYPEGSDVSATIKAVTNFGLRIDTEYGLETTVHKSDLSWTQRSEDALKTFEVGQKLILRVMEVNPEKERIKLSLKHMQTQPEMGVQLKKGAIVTCIITEVHDSGLAVSFLDGGDAKGFIRRAELSRDRDAQRPNGFGVGEKVDAKLIVVDTSNRNHLLSIKALEMDEEKKAIETYGSSSSGATLGDILGKAIGRFEEEQNNK